jgi:hypothetical protein
MQTSRAFVFLSLLAVSAAVASADSPVCATAGNLIQNCAFNEGLNPAYLPGADVPADWTELGTWDSYDSLTQAESLEPGGYSVKNGDDPPYLTGVGQTVTDVAGQSYTLSFWLLQDGDNTTGPGQAYGAEWDGNIVFAEIDQPASTSWTEFSVTVVGTGSDTVALGGDSYHGYNYLDDVSLTPVPEGGSLALCLFGLVAIGLRMGIARRGTGAV